MRYVITMTAPNGERVELERTRRFNGAVNVLQLHLDSKKAQLQGKTLPGERVVVGPEDRDGELAGASVVLLCHDGTDVIYHYSIEEIQRGNDHT